MSEPIEIREAGGCCPQAHGPALDPLPYEERRKWCYCRLGQTHCGKCDDCGKPGHLRALMFLTACWCDDCYAIALDKVMKEEPNQ